MSETLTDTQELIIAECRAIEARLLEKNRKYGDSAINPVRVFSKADPVEQINVRLDDKLSRKKSDQADEDEDVDFDIIGYLILKRVAQRTNASKWMDELPNSLESDVDFSLFPEFPFHINRANIIDPNKHVNITYREGDHATRS